MTIAQDLLKELELEASTTRRVLERVPIDQLAWRPVPSARSLGELVQHIVENPGSVSSLAAANPGIVPPPEAPAPFPTSTAELVARLDASMVRAREVFNALSDSEVQESWKMIAGGNVLMEIPRLLFLRLVVLNHWYHHRGQLSVYLRQLGVSVPSIYGPSADENPFA